MVNLKLGIKAASFNWIHYCYLYSVIMIYCLMFAVMLIIMNKTELHNALVYGKRQATLYVALHISQLMHAFKQTNHQILQWV